MARKTRTAAPAAKPRFEIGERVGIQNSGAGTPGIADMEGGDGVVIAAWPCGFTVRLSDGCEAEVYTADLYAL
jgi:hypothetical protein